MEWNWQQADWPNFSFAEPRLAQAEERFLLGSGVIFGAASHLRRDDHERLTVEFLGSEALTTSEIEGEILNRESVQSSIRRELGLGTDRRRSGPAETGIAEMTVDVHRRYAAPLQEATLCSWHTMLMRGRRHLEDIGRYRTHSGRMRVVSGPSHDPRVHFEAPPSARVTAEMSAFLEWFNRTAPSGSDPLPALTRAGIAHLYFVGIHPFEDGNGRIARAIAEKALAQRLGRPSFAALASTILPRRRQYYEALERNNKHTEITDWLTWFAGIGLEAQFRTRAQVEFLIEKSKLLDRVKNLVNERQLKVLVRMLREGPTGFLGGLSAGNYVSIAGTSPATATRDLAELVGHGALTRTGERRYTRYHLTIPRMPVPKITIDGSGAILTGGYSA